LSKKKEGKTNEKAKAPKPLKEEKKARAPRKPKTPPVPKVAEYNAEGKEICPACKERKFKVQDCDSAGDGNIKFTVKCPCGHVFSYLRNVKTMYVSKPGGIDSGSAEVAATKLRELPERGNRSARNTRSRSAGAKRKRKK